MEKISIPMEELYQLLRVQLEKGSANLVVTGDSMYPTLRDRVDSVTLTRPEEPLRKYDLILYRRDSGQYVLHRIVGSTPEGYLCCGDNQWDKETVREDQILALVTDLTRSGRFIPVSDPGYRRWSRIWTALLPLRRPLIGIRRCLGRVKRSMMKSSRKRR